MVYASKFDENSDLSTTYLVQGDMTRSTNIKAEDKGLLQENYWMAWNAKFC